MNVQLFIPCFIDQLYPQVGFNMVKVLQKAGCTVHYNTNQTCCGQPAFNAGFWGESKEVCSKFIKDFSGDEFVVAPSASCIGFVKNYYPKLFENTSMHNEVKSLTEKVYEFSDFLVNIVKIESFGASLPAKATYHDSCAALRECGLKQEPRKLLQQVAGLELVEMNDVETCCGFGGTFAVKFEPISAAMGDQKISNALATEAEYIISTDMSCLMHLQGIINYQQKPIQVMHLADVLASGW
ncbi:MAG: (Fe-S)-binding protein [Sphingobacteriales bacterium]|uniref:(Fe-S)-binding protein n=1 Tax=Hydrotalea flava TaxID=714549 RepID=UPI00082BEAFD|nr:(Fe-S)-binding protein [Hydrotalea flava]RTL56674.1 MAG: (Fe-S)-binding protein [Sphingobacteriales bacterium]